MEKYNSLYKWMIIPMVIMQFGIFGDYWWDFSDNAWSVHIHYWTGTAWYSFLILQPYLIAKADYARHRTYGIIGIFLAGGVCLTALSMLNRDIVNSQKAAELPERFGPFQPWFFYGVAAVEPVMMLAFGYAVMMAIIHRDEIENHAWWLISTVFLIMMPALGRGIQNLYIALNFKDWPNVDIMFPLYLTQFIILALLLLGAWKYKKLSHPATYLAVAVNIFILLIEPLGRSTSVQAFLNAVFKG
jgi:hypothetical protein